MTELHDHQKDETIDTSSTKLVPEKGNQGKDSGQNIVGPETLQPLASLAGSRDGISLNGENGKIVSLNSWKI